MSTIGPTARLRYMFAATAAASALVGLALGRARCRQPQSDDAAVHRHELINAFAAIEGAAMILERENIEGERAKVHRLLVSEISHLRDLLDFGGAALNHA